MKVDLSRPRTIDKRNLSKVMRFIIGLSAIIVSIIQIEDENNEMFRILRWYSYSGDRGRQKELHRNKKDL